MSELDRAGNLLGALALSIADRTGDAVEESAGQSQSAAIALSALHHFAGGATVDKLRRVLGLTPSGAVRLVDRLQEAGLVERERGGDDKRAIALRLTPKGTRAAKRVSGARADVLEHALGALDAREREVFDELLAKVIVRQIRDPGATRWLCRLCDMDACGRDDGNCPVAEEAKRRFATAKT